MDILDGGATEILLRTPGVLRALLTGLPEAWLHAHEGPEIWSPWDVLGHLIHGEKTDWIPRIHRVLEDGPSRPFDPFDRFAQFEESRGKTLVQLLDAFSELRTGNLRELDALSIREEQLALTGTHPDFGPVTLGQVLATWAAHDLGHIAQITRGMARQYREEVGPWREYLPVMGPRAR